MADSRGFTDSLDNQKNQFSKYSDTDTGPYVGVVKYTQDPLKMGRLGVNIPALTNTSEPSASQIVWCQYLSPFYGAKSPRAISKSDPSDYKLTQHSYGFWAIPPDIDTEVLVIFAKAETAARNAFWIKVVRNARKGLPFYRIRAMSKHKSFMSGRALPDHEKRRADRPNFLESEQVENPSN